MSLRSFFFPQLQRLLRDKFGATLSIPTGIDSENNQLVYESRDTGVQTLAEEMYAILATTGPIKLNEPVQFERGDGYTGPLMEFIDNSEGPTITIGGDNTQTNINLGNITHSVNTSLNTEITNGDTFNITNVEGDPDVTQETLPDNGVVTTGPGGGSTQIPDSPGSQSKPGKIVSGSGTTYKIDYYGDGPFESKTETIDGAICFGAESGWKLRPGTWVDVKKSGNKHWFINPPLTIIHQVEIFSNRADTMLVVGEEVGEVAKPATLRRTPFDGENINGITYSYNSNDERTATLSNGVQETQRVIPLLEEHEATIFVAWIPTGTGVSDSNGEPIHWLDLNVDGRAWAGVCV